MIPFCKKRTLENKFLTLSEIKLGGKKDICDFSRAYLRHFIQTEIAITENSNVVLLYDESLGVGAYGLNISDTLEIRYSNQEGVRNALATFLQLIRIKDEKYTLQYQNILDYPDCLHRSVMIDLARGLPQKQRLKEDLKRLSLAKCNRVHLHLMDEEGICYRSNVFAFNSEINGTKIYSKEDIKELVCYCKELGMEVIPEFEFPAHATSLTKIYPNFKCQVEVDNQSDWTVCMGNEDVYVFFEKLIEEICELFPYEYIHIGGDEHAFDDVPALHRHYYWNECKVCQAVMKKEGLSNSRELFYYGVRRIREIAKKLGRKIILWNDALDVSKPVDIPKDCIVQFWRIANRYRGPREGCSFEKFLQADYNVICSPFEYCYIDLEEYANPEKIASFDYKAYANEGEFANNICGCEVCAWEYGNPEYSHYIYSFAPSAILLLAKMWDRQNVTYDKAFRKELSRLILGFFTPTDYDLFELFGSIMPPRINGQNSYATIQNELMDMETLSRHKQTLLNIQYTYSPLYLQAIQRLIKES